MRWPTKKETRSSGSAFNREEKKGKSKKAKVKKGMKAKLPKPPDLVLAFSPFYFLLLPFYFFSSRSFFFIGLVRFKYHCCAMPTSILVKI